MTSTWYPPIEFTTPRLMSYSPIQYNWPHIFFHPTGGYKMNTEVINDPTIASTPELQTIPPITELQTIPPMISPNSTKVGQERVDKFNQESQSAMPTSTFVSENFVSENYSHSDYRSFRAFSSHLEFRHSCEILIFVLFLTIE